MFGKLLKYEWRASKRLLGVASLVLLGVGVLCSVLLRIFTVVEKSLTEDASMVIGVTVIAAGTLFLGLSLVVYSVATQIWLAVRFYKNKYTDEGYLTFTLPVNSHQIFLSSLVNHILWTVICALTVLAVMAMIFVFGSAEEGLFNEDGIRGVWDFISTFVETVYTLSKGELAHALQLLSVLVGVISTPIVIMTSITLGAVAAKKHKVLAAIGIYYAINLVTGLLTTVVTTAVSISSVVAGATFDADGYSIALTVGQLVLQTALAVAGYFTSTALMRRKLNLP